jgi:hypothetical protein
MIKSLNSLASAVAQYGPVELAQNGTAAIRGMSVVAVYEASAGVKATPNMTSNVLPSGVVTVSANIDTESDAYRMFDGAGYMPEISFNYNSLGYAWLAYQFSSQIKIVSYTIMTQTVYDRAPRAWRMEGSNDGANWTTIDTRTAQVFVDQTMSGLYIVQNPGNYSYYRMYVTEMLNGGGYLYIGELVWYLAGGFTLMQPNIDYTVTKGGVGTQDMTVKRLKAGSNTHIIEYF